MEENYRWNFFRRSSGEISEGKEGGKKRGIFLIISSSLFFIFSVFMFQNIKIFISLLFFFYDFCFSPMLSVVCYRQNLFGLAFLRSARKKWREKCTISLHDIAEIKNSDAEAKKRRPEGENDWWNSARVLGGPRMDEMLHFLLDWTVERWTKF